jgi:hemolysin activation/secretion protein
MNMQSSESYAQGYSWLSSLVTGIKCLVMVAVGESLLTVPVLAQTPPRAVEPRPQPTLPPPEELLDPELTTPTLEVPDDSPEPDLPDNTISDEVTLVVNRFEVVGSTVFSEAELQAVLVPFTGPLTLAELLAARSAVTQLYIDAGYVSSGAYIPPQEPENGVVTMQVVEGRLAEIEVQGTSRLHPAYVRNRLALGATPPLKIDSLVEQLRLLQLDPLIANISGELSAGLEPGTNRLVVTVEEADSFDVDFVTNNQRSPLVGTWERGLFLNEGNLSGWGDRLQVGYLNTNGSDRAIADYRIPLNARNGTLAVHFEYTHSQVISEPEAILGITTDSLLADLSFRQPIIRTPTEELALSLIGSWQRSRTVYLEELTGQAFPFPAFGANDDGEIEVFALRFAQDWTKRGSRDVLAARSQFNLGLGGSTPTNLSGNAPDGNFFSWLGQAQWARLLAPDTLLLVRGEAQFANDTLPSQELFGLGGQRTVRGYRQDRLLTDNALLATAEVRLPVLRNQEHQSLLQVVPFFDVGTGWNTRLNNPDPNTLVGTGVGLLWTEDDYWSARLDWGIPLNGSESGNSWQENGLYFSIGVNTF